MRIVLGFVVALLSACGGGASGSGSGGIEPPAPVDAVGVFLDSMGYRFTPENVGYSGSGPIISDGSGRALGAMRWDTGGAVYDYSFSRSGGSTSGTLYLRRYLSTDRCSGNATGAVTDNSNFTIDNFVLTNVNTAQECRGGVNPGQYEASTSEWPGTLAEMAGNYSSTAGPANNGGAFDSDGNRFTVVINPDGGIQIGTASGCLSVGTIALIESGKGVARISRLTSCGSDQTPLDGLAAFDGATLLIIVAQPNTQLFYYGFLTKS